MLWHRKHGKQNWGRGSNSRGSGLRRVLTLLSAVYLLWITAEARTLRRGWKRIPANSGWATCACAVVLEQVSDGGG